ncbi:MAG TPA: LacI family DNA-binding transcriptional regulator [Chthoniobacteraceae bacterium]|nr:LacI family DNA-binding transcriptional regulator [Chthoniobacteraceae bacterium]
MKKSPTLKEVGAHAGVTAATASMALRRDARISLETQKRVQRAAEELEYRPDPILSALVSRRKGTRARRALANLAILIDERWLIQGQPPLWMQGFLDGAAQMAQRLGYEVSPLYYPRDLVPGANADRILHARGIRGVALFPLPGEQKGFTLDWDHYALVVIGHPRLPQMPHRAGSDAFAAMNLICQKLRDYGYRRVGLAHERHQENELRHEFLGALMKEHHLHRTFRAVPPHLPEQLRRDGFLAWVKKHRPEAIITVEERLLHWLREEGWNVPGEIGIAFLNTHILQTPDASGTLLHNSATGENAIELLHSQLLCGETGFPETVKEMLTFPHWQEGRTLCQQR